MKYTHSIILIHGFTMSSDDMKYYIDKLKNIIPNNYNIKYICPTSPKRKITIYKEKKYNSWYDYLTPDCDKEPIINEKHLLETRNKIHNIMKKEINYHKDPLKIFLLGISQGCCIAIDASITFPIKIGGVIGIKGHVISKSLKDFKKNQTMIITHGKKDKTIHWKFAKKTYENLKKKNPQIKIILQENVNHSIPSGIILDMKNIKQWIIPLL